MALFNTRTTELCRQRAAGDRFLRRFSAAPAAPPDDDGTGPGWYDSSRELEAGLEVHEADAALFEDWLEARRRWVQASRRAADQAERP